MQEFKTMALGGHDKEILRKNMEDGHDTLHHNNVTLVENSEQIEREFSSEKNADDVDVFNSFVIDRSSDDFHNSSDSLSSSASISDSDLTSTDSEDSLGLSESESITDVTPLNSPYCDSPLPQSKHTENKTEDKTLGRSMMETARKEYEGSDDYRRPEMNVLLRAIEKLQMEAKQTAEQQAIPGNLLRKRSASYSGEEAKRIEQENQRLFKRVISQQSRIRSVLPMASPPGHRNLSLGKHQELVKSDDDISKSPSPKSPKEGARSHARRQQKCLSHPSSFTYSCGHLSSKILANDAVSTKSDEKGVHMSSEEAKESSWVPNAANYAEDQVTKY